MTSDGTSVATTRVERANIREQAASILREQILDGTYEPGARLNEVEIADAMGTSRGPLREALQRLAAEGLVDLVPNRGAFVRTFSPVELKQMYEFRQIIESGAARLAAQRASASDVAALRSMLDETDQLLGMTADVAYPATPDFHHRILELSGNAALVRAGTELQTQVHIARQSSGRRPGRARAAFEEHAGIVDAIEARDGDAAAEAMARHLAHSLASLGHQRMQGDDQ